MNKQTFIKLLQDFGVITNNRVETAVHLTLAVPFILVALLGLALFGLLGLMLDGYVSEEEELPERHDPNHIPYADPALGDSKYVHTPYYDYTYYTDD